MQQIMSTVNTKVLKPQHIKYAEHTFYVILDVIFQSNIDVSTDLAGRHALLATTKAFIQLLPTFAICTFLSPSIPCSFTFLKLPAHTTVCCQTIKEKNHPSTELRRPYGAHYDNPSL